MFLPFSSANMINYSDLYEYCSSNDIVSFHALIRQICDDNATTIRCLLTGTKGVQSPLHVAVQHGSDSIVEAILEYSTTIDAFEAVTRSQNSMGETPLHLACAMGNLSAAILLLRSPESVEVGRRADCIKDKWGRTPWRVAVENGYDKKLGALLEAPHSIHSDGPSESALDNAAFLQKDPHQEILTQGIRKEFLALAASKSQPQGEDGDAMKEVHVTVKTIFGEYSEQIHRRLRPAFFDASSPARGLQAHSLSRMAQLRAEEAASAFLLPVAVPDRRVAISKHLEYPGDPAALERMVANSSEFNINGKDMFGLTALHKLSSWDKPDLLAILLNGSERVDARSVTAGDGFTCLHCAVNMRALASLEWLLRALPEEDLDAILSKQDKQGRTPLELAEQINGGESSADAFVKYLHTVAGLAAAQLPKGIVFAFTS
eukprot:gene24479-32930_t